MKKIYFLLASVFSFSLAIAQPANDDCATAQAIGSLPTPAACPSGAGSSLTIAGTLNSATAANPYTYQGTGCTGTSTSMAAPANDVWYTFVATGYQLNLTITGSVVNPNVALYSGTCAALGGGIGGCAVGTAGGNATLTVYQMVIGTTYYIQISGNSTGAGGNFSMTINNSIDCNNCLGASNLTVTPPPTNGAYAPGTTVNFCFKVNSYTQVNTNWLHGVQLSFGSCWNLGSLTTTPPSACQGSGTWAYFPAGIGVVNGVNWGPGFYFDTTDPGTSASDNFGDNCSGTISAANWNFCFSITTAAACNPGCNLSVVINTSGDGESGSWSSNGCNGDPAANFSAIGACCPPTMAATSACAGQATGSATATPVGAAGPYTYTWTPGGQNTQTATGLTPGVYTVSVIDANGCLATNTVTVGTLPTPTITVNSPAICIGGSTTLNAAGATTYSWTPATGLSATTGASVTANPTSTTTYTISGTSGGCTGTVTSVVTVNPLPIVTVNSATICPGGSITLTATGASTYAWSPGTGLSATTGASVTANPTVTTTYTITGTSVAGCTATATSTVTIGAGITLTVNSATICSGSSTTLTASGATTYSWTPATGLSATTGASVTANPTSTTTYTITGTSGGCTGTVTSVVTVNPIPTVTVNSATFCIGGSTTLNATGATTYSWTPATGLSATTGASVTANPTSTTTYTITGTSGGCTGTVTSVVTVNPLPTINVTNGTVCNGASAPLTASGATTYTWSPATGLSATTGANVNANPATTTSYTVIGTDANGCVNTGTTTVTVVTNPTVTVNAATICNGQQTATLTANGATTYVWSPATGLSATTGSVVTANPTTTTTYTIIGTAGTCTATATSVVTVNPIPIVTVNSGTICIGQQTANLNAGGAVTYTWTPATGLNTTSGANVVANPTITTSYTVVGIDANGCVNFATTSVVVNPLPIVTVNSAFICNGGSTTLTANGAVTYTWTPGTGLSSTNGSPVTATPATTTSYTVLGTNANGCISGDTTTVTVVTNPVVTVTTSTICAGQQTATLTANGATTYVWTPATGLSATTGSVVTANPATTTAYTITGTVGTCTAVGTTTVTVNAIPIVTVNSGTICIGQQTANLNAAGAVTYTWTPATGLSATSGANVVANPTTTTSYTVVGVDANGCVNFATTSVLVNPLPIVTVNSALICNGNSATLTANGATTYTWTPGTGLSSANGSPVTASPTTTTSYTVLGTNANGCVSGDTTTVTVVNNPIITVTTGTICAGQQTATLTANGATTYVWTPATGLSATTGNIVTANPATTTVYTITGTVGTCTAIGTTTVTVNPLPVPTIGSNSPVCVNQTLNLNAGGATGYSWNGPNSFTATMASPSITGITLAATGIYTVTVVDANMCVNTATVSVVVNPLPIVTATGSTVCLNATINLGATGGIGYSWSGPVAYTSNLQNPTILNATTAMAGIYVVTVTDANNCVNANVAQVVINPLPTVTVNSGTICVGQQTANLNAIGANTYNWTPALGLSSTTGASVVANPSATSSYTVTGTDLNNCQNTATLTVMVNPLPLVAVSPQITSGCAPVCVNFSNTATGIGTCSWNFGNGSTSTSCAPNNCFTAQGNFSISLTLTDNNGCVNSSSASVTVYPVPHADFYATPQPTTILDNAIHFYDLTTGAFINSWAWNLGNGTHAVIQNPSCLYGDTGSYEVQLVVISNHGCKDSTIKIVRIDDDYSLYVPNAFSPNSDGTNDIFYAKGEGVRDFKMYIFDRWGNQVFFSDNLYKGWDGRYQAKGDQIVQEDVYVWKIEVKNIKGEKRQLSGHVSLLK